MNEKLQKKLPAGFLLDAAILIVLSGLAFLPGIGSLGFYRDDWHMIWSANTQGFQGVLRLFTIDRPFMGLVYGLEYLFLGESPLAWNLYAYLLRLAGALGFYWLLRMIWPKRSSAVMTMTLVFLLYPGFLQLPNGNTFQNHLLGYGLAIFSIAFSVKAFLEKTRPRKIIWMIASVLLAFPYFLIYEYMIGLEGARWTLIGYLVWRSVKEDQSKKRLLKRFFFEIGPNVMALALFLAWRLLFFKSARSVTDVGQLSRSYLSDPLQMFTRLGVETVRDAFETLFLSWAVPFYQLTSQSTIFQFLASLTIAGLGIGLLFVYWKIRIKQVNEVEKDHILGDSPSKDWMWLGFLITLMALLPVIFANRQVLFSDTFDRYTLHATLGVGLFWGGLLHFSKGNSNRMLLAALLLAAMITHTHNNYAFAREWDYQRQLWWQLTWRAPDLRDGTVVVPQLPAGNRLSEGYEVWAPLNLIYRPGDSDLPITGEVLNHETLMKILQRETTGRSMRRIEYKNDYKNTLLISLPEGGSCVHVIDGQRPELPGDEDPLVRLAAKVSDIKWIVTEGTGKSPPESIFGKEPEHLWCYYYQKADLARQSGDWETVLALWDEAQQAGLEPTSTVEWMPVYEAYVFKRFDQLSDITRRIREDTDFIRSYCSINSEQIVVGAEDETLEDFVVTNLCVQ